MHLAWQLIGGGERALSVFTLEVTRALLDQTNGTDSSHTMPLCKEAQPGPEVQGWIEHTQGLKHIMRYTHQTYKAMPTRQAAARLCTWARAGCCCWWWQWRWRWKWC